MVLRKRGREGQNLKRKEDCFFFPAWAQWSTLFCFAFSCQPLVNETSFRIVALPPDHGDNTEIVGSRDTLSQTLKLQEPDTTKEAPRK